MFEIKARVLINSELHIVESGPCDSVASAKALVLHKLDLLREEYGEIAEFSFAAHRLPKAAQPLHWS